jgi:hypothetical protein
VKLPSFLRPQIIFPIPAGQVADAAGANGLIGLMQNVNNYSESLSSVGTSGTTISLIAQSAIVGTGAAGNLLAGFVMLNAGATGALTVTLPSTSSMIAALGNTVPLDGSYSEPVHIMNNSGQTATLAAGDANTTMLGSAVVAVGSVRKLLLRVLNSSNLSITNVGTWTF